MENIKIFAGKYYLSTTVKTDNLNSYLSWMKNPLENQYMLSAKGNYSIGELCTFIDNCNKDKNTSLLGIYDKIDDDYVGNIHALKLCQKLGFQPIANKSENGLLINLNINELKNNDS
jgi:hypothetical protein